MSKVKKNLAPLRPTPKLTPTPPTLVPHRVPFLILSTGLNSDPWGINLSLNSLPHGHGILSL